MTSKRTYPWTRKLLYIPALPWNLLVWFIVAWIRLLWGNKLWWSEGSLWTELYPNSWPTRTWYRRKVHGDPVVNPSHRQFNYGQWQTWAGTTLGHGGWYGPGISKGTEVDTVTEVHEHIHVEQFETYSLFGFIMGVAAFGGCAAAGHWMAGALVGGWFWLLGGPLGFSCGWMVAILRGEPAYRGSIHEEHAYSAAHDVYLDFYKRKPGEE